MVKKLGLSSLLFKLKDTPRPSCYFSSPSTSSNSSWPWPSCKHPKTNSFRDTTQAENNDTIYKTVNSVYFDSADSTCCFTHSSSSEEEEEHDESLTTLSQDSAVHDQESVVRELSSAHGHRLFFEPGDTSSILEEAKSGEFPFKQSVVMAMESRDPYVDFRRSMEEMVMANSIKDWEGLEELLVWYLRVNGKKTHAFIVGAFVDLLVAFASQTNTNTTSSSSSSIAFEVDDDDDVQGRKSEKQDNNSSA